MTQSWPMVALGNVIRHRKEFIEIDDLKEYKRCRVQLHAKGVVLRDIIEGYKIKTKQQQVCRADELLVAEIDAKVGGFGIVPDCLDGALVSSHYFLYVIDETVLDKQFLDYYIRTRAFRSQVSARGSTNYAAIRAKQVLEYQVPLPPLVEQRRIVARVGELTSQVEMAQDIRQQALEQTEKLTALFVAQALGSKVVDGHLSDVLIGKPRNGWSARCDNAEKGTPVLSLSAVTRFVYKENEFKRTSEPTKPEAHYWLQKGDLLITRSNTPQLVGHAAIYSGAPSPCIYPDLMMRLAVDESQADTRFVHWWLRSTSVRKYIIENAKGTSPTMKKISQKTVMGIPFPLGVSLAEQRRIVAHLEDLQAKLLAVQQRQIASAAELGALLPSILDKAFTGEL